MIIIDGSQGEGGGQILRTSLALSLVTGKPFRIENIRARRKKPGLLRQHLTAVNAARDIGAAKVSGNSIGSQVCSFEPQAISGGKYHFSIGTAGSCTLVLQAILPALLKADKPSIIILEGGTHNPFAPPFPYLDSVFLPLLRRMGVTIKATLERPGFYPAGGGRFRIEIEPSPLRRLELKERGPIINRRIRAIVSHLPVRIAEDEVATVREQEDWKNCDSIIEEIQKPCGPGNVMFLEVESEHITEVFTGFGQRGVPAVKVARRVLSEAEKYIQAEVPVGPWLADQLLVPMALAGGGSFVTLKPTSHTLTNNEIIATFLDIPIVTKKTNNHYLFTFGNQLSA